MRDIEKILEMWKTLPLDGKVKETEDIKFLASPDYNFIFDKHGGKFARWGKTEDADPQWSPFGPEIADIEVTTICSGVRGKDGKESVCKFCYKANTPQGNNMSLETFKTVFGKLPKTLTQVAFGADSHATSNPDLWNMMEHCRVNGVVPNITVADITDETADKLAAYCGAVAVSYYPQQNKDACYDSIKRLTDRGVDQINIHCCIHADSYEDTLQLLEDAKTDNRLSKLNAIVFLSLKQKGRGVNYRPLDKGKFKNIIDVCLEKNIPFGFDSCSCHKFLSSVKDDKNFERFKTLADPCESTCFSIFFNWEGKMFPCSFCDRANEEWKDGIQVTEDTDFLKDVWMHPRVQEFRDKLLKNGRNCPIYDI